MPRYRAEPTLPDRAKAAASVAAVYAVIVTAVLILPGDRPTPAVESEPTVLIAIEDLPRPEPPPEELSGKAEKEEGASGKKAEPTPVVAPEAAIDVPARSPVVAAPVAGSGTAATAGSADSGTGPGAGGTGSGRGGGGSGGGGIGTQARLLGGQSQRLPARLLRSLSAERGYAHLQLRVTESGRVSDCSVIQTSGAGPVDEALCNIMLRQSRWSPARDRQGRPISVTLRYTATWKKN